MERTVRRKNLVSPAVVFVNGKGSLYPQIFVVDPENKLPHIIDILQTASLEFFDTFLLELFFKAQEATFYVFINNELVRLERAQSNFLVPRWDCAVDEESVSFQFSCINDGIRNTHFIPLGSNFVIALETRQITALSLACTKGYVNSYDYGQSLGFVVQRAQLPRLLKKTDSFKSSYSYSIPLAKTAQFFDFVAYLHDCAIALYKNNKRVIKHALYISVDVAEDENGNFIIVPFLFKNGCRLSQVELEVLLATETLWYETEHEVHMFDELTYKIFELLRYIQKNYKKIVDAKYQVSFLIPRNNVFVIYLLGYYDILAAPSEDFSKMLAALYDHAHMKASELPDKIVYTLHEYQRKGYDWLSFLYQHKFGACLADEMGLGKTIQTITFLAGIHEKKIIVSNLDKKRPHLIVAPGSVISNWEQEIKKFYPAFVTHLYVGPRRIVEPAAVDIILTTYETVRQDINYLKTIPFHVLIIDEAQVVKNNTSQRAQALMQLKALFTVCLTGTPLENNIQELRSILTIAVPGLVFESVGKESIITQDTVDALHEKVGPFFLRRTKDEHLNLPEKIEHNVYLEMDVHQRKMYQIVVDGVKRLIEKAYAEKTAAQAGIVALTALLQLRQICISPLLFENRGMSTKENSSPKLNYLLQDIMTKQAERIPVLVFSQFTGALDIFAHMLTKQKISYLRIDGSIPLTTRRKIIEQFQKSRTIFVLLLSLKTGGVGITLTRARVVYHLDPWWNPAVENQASDRVHRIGQKHSVEIIRLIMKDSIEEKMLLLKQKKQELFDLLIKNTGIRESSSHLTHQDFDFLLE